jgi:hypothetical protein
MDKEISLICATSGVKEFVDKLDKIVYILMNYVGEEKITANQLALYFNVSRNSIRKRMWSTFLGYKVHDKSKPKYLAPLYEEKIADALDLKNKKMNSVIKEEVTTMVKNYNYNIISDFFRHLK